MRPKLSKLATLMDGAEEDVLAYMTFPKQHRTKLHSTNSIERLNGQTKRRTNVVGFVEKTAPHAVFRSSALLNEASIRRLFDTILMEQTEGWTVRRGRYMTPETLAPVCDESMVSLPAAQRD